MGSNSRFSVLFSLFSISCAASLTQFADASESGALELSSFDSAYADLQDQSAIFAAVLSIPERAEFFILLNNGNVGVLDELDLARLQSLISKSKNLINAGDTIEYM